ncbi:hypothetical protein Q7P35_010813 [Cladosporium inversicolor]
MAQADSTIFRYGRRRSNSVMRRYAPYRDYAAAALVEVADDAKMQLAQGWGRRIPALNSGVAADKPTTRAIRDTLPPLMRRCAAGIVGVSSRPRDEMHSTGTSHLTCLPSSVTRPDLFRPARHHPSPMLCIRQAFSLSTLTDRGPIPCTSERNNFIYTDTSFKLTQKLQNGDFYFTLKQNFTETMFVSSRTIPFPNHIPNLTQPQPSDGTSTQIINTTEPYHVSNITAGFPYDCTIDPYMDQYFIHASGVCETTAPLTIPVLNASLACPYAKSVSLSFPIDVRTE